MIKNIGMNPPSIYGFYYRIPSFKMQQHYHYTRTLFMSVFLLVCPKYHPFHSDLQVSGASFIKFSRAKKNSLYSFLMIRNAYCRQHKILYIYFYPFLLLWKFNITSRHMAQKPRIIWMIEKHHYNAKAYRLYLKIILCRNKLLS